MSNDSTKCAGITGLVCIILLALLSRFIFRPDPVDFFNKQNEYIRGLMVQIKDIPECSERLLQILTYDSYIKDPLNTKFVSSAREKGPLLPSLSEKEVTRNVKLLEEWLEQEKLLSLVKKSYEKAKRMIEFGEWKEAHNELEGLLKAIRPLDIIEMYRLINKADDIANLIKDRDIVLFLGPTGAGKTSTIHFLAGSEMIETTEDNMYHIAPSKIKNRDLDNAVTSPASTSLTRYITPVHVNLNDLDSALSGSMILCDSPGTGDSAGAEVDIANGIGVFKAIKSAQSVKPVILISCKGIGNRLEGLRDLLNTLASVMPDVRSNLNTFSYYFTRCTYEERHQIYPTLVNIRKSLKNAEESNENLVALLNALIRKTEKEIIVIDLLKDKPGTLLRKLEDSPAIFHPDRVFKFMITPKSKETVLLQVEKHRKSIFNSIDRSDYELANYKLQELLKLNDTLGYEEINAAFNECVTYLMKHLYGDNPLDISYSLNQCLKNHNVGANCDAHIKDYKTRHDTFKSIDSFMARYLTKSALRANTLVQNLKEQAQSMLDSLAHMSINENAVGVILDNLKLLSLSFPEVKSTYQDACNRLREKIDEAVMSSNKHVLLDEFHKSAGQMNEIYQSISVLDKHLDHSILETRLDTTKDFLIQSLGNCTVEGSSIFMDKRLGNSHIDAIGKCASRIELAKAVPLLNQYVKASQFNKMHTQLLHKLSRHSEEVYERLGDFFSSQSGNPIKELRELQENLNSGSKLKYTKRLRDFEEIVQELKVQIDVMQFLISQHEKYASDSAGYKDL